jgi:hypothetical protein
MSKQHTITVHTISEDGLPPRDFDTAGLVGRVAFIFDGSLYSGWPLKVEGKDGYDENAEYPSDPEEVEWEDGETARHFTGIKKWVELPVAGWDL